MVALPFKSIDVFQSVIVLTAYPLVLIDLNCPVLEDISSRIIQGPVMSLSRQIWAIIFSLRKSSIIISRLESGFEFSSLSSHLIGPPENYCTFLFIQVAKKAPAVHIFYLSIL